MSTKATVLFKEDGNSMVKIYQHWDGDPEEFGLEVAKFFSNIKIVNGFGKDQEVLYRFANGFGCAVSQFISKIKTCVGNVYIDTINSGNEFIDFNYVINYDSEKEEYKVSVSCYEMNFFEGTMKEFLNFCENPIYPDEDEDVPMF
jgi:hypothetical protein